MPATMNATLPAYAAIIVAAGKGERAGGGTPKQFRKLRGKPVLRWSAERFAYDPRCHALLIVHSANEADQVKHIAGDLKGIMLTEGGKTRQQSVRNGLEVLAAAGQFDHVLIHDAARPFLPLPVIDALLSTLEHASGAVPVLPVTDTVVETEKGKMSAVVSRERLRRVQTPQAFRFEAILNAHRNWQGEDATDDAQMLRQQGLDIALVEGSVDLEKITFAEDLARMENSPTLPLRFAIGMGYDVHRLVSDKELWIGGIQIEHSHGLSGHSDADVALHALTDAILGALAEGDIGQHFPPSDSQWKDASSDRFLAYAGERVTERGGEIHSIDLTIICEAPKIGPHREAIRARIAEILRLPVERVSVKATTTEGLGFAGRREGIAAQAIASIALP